jgi:hypothetical protein
MLQSGLRTYVYNHKVCFVTTKYNKRIVPLLYRYAKSDYRYTKSGYRYMGKMKLLKFKHFKQVAIGTQLRDILEKEFSE